MSTRRTSIPSNSTPRPPFRKFAPKRLRATGLSRWANLLTERTVVVGEYSREIRSTRVRSRPRVR